MVIPLVKSAKILLLSPYRLYYYHSSYCRPTLHVHVAVFKADHLREKQHSQDSIRTFRKKLDPGSHVTKKLDTDLQKQSVFRSYLILTFFVRRKSQRLSIHAVL